MIYSSRSRAPPLPELAKLGDAILEGDGNRKQEIDPDVCTTLHAGGGGEGLWTWRNKPLLRYSAGGRSSRHKDENSTDAGIEEVSSTMLGNRWVLVFSTSIMPLL